MGWDDWTPEMKEKLARKIERQGKTELYSEVPPEYRSEAMQKYVEEHTEPQRGIAGNKHDVETMLKHVKGKVVKQGYEGGTYVARIMTHSQLERIGKGIPRAQEAQEESKKSLATQPPAESTTSKPGKNIINKQAEKHKITREQAEYIARKQIGDIWENIPRSNKEKIIDVISQGATVTVTVNEPEFEFKDPLQRTTKVRDVAKKKNDKPALVLDNELKDKTKTIESKTNRLRKEFDLLESEKIAIEEERQTINLEDQEEVEAFNKKVEEYNRRARELRQEAEAVQEEIIELEGTALALEQKREWEKRTLPGTVLTKIEEGRDWVDKNLENVVVKNIGLAGYDILTGLPATFAAGRIARHEKAELLEWSEKQGISKQEAEMKYLPDQREEMKSALRETTEFFKKEPVGAAAYTATAIATMFAPKLGAGKLGKITGRGVEAATKKFSPVVEVTELRGFDVGEVVKVTEGGKALEVQAIKPRTETYKTLRLNAPELKPVKATVQADVKSISTTARKIGREYESRAAVQEGTGTLKLDITPKVEEPQFEMLIEGEKISRPVKHIGSDIDVELGTAELTTKLVGGTEISKGIKSEWAFDKGLEVRTRPFEGDISALEDTLVGFRRTSYRLRVKQPEKLTEGQAKLIEKRYWEEVKKNWEEPKLTEEELLKMEKLERTEDFNKIIDDIYQPRKVEIDLRKAGKEARRAEAAAKKAEAKAEEATGAGDLILETEAVEVTELEKYPILRKEPVGIRGRTIESIMKDFSRIKAAPPTTKPALDFNEVEDFDVDFDVDIDMGLEEIMKEKVKQRYTPKSDEMFRQETKGEQSLENITDEIALKIGERIGEPEAEDVFLGTLTAQGLKTDYRTPGTPFPDLIRSTDPMEIPGLPPFSSKGGDVTSGFWYDWWKYTEKINPIDPIEAFAGKPGRGRRNKDDFDLLL